VICRWPENSEARWGGTGKVGDWQYKPMDDGAERGKPKDSCVVLYWGELNMPPKSTRKLGFTSGGREIPDRFLEPFLPRGAQAGRPDRAPSLNPSEG